MSGSIAKRKTVVVIIALTVGLLHFVTGPGYSGPFPVFVNGYLIDILLPFAMFLVLGLVDHPVLRSRVSRGCAVFGVGAVAETLQYAGVPLFGQTFDLLDYVMFGVGIGMAVIFEAAVLARMRSTGTPRCARSRD
ncbi:MAG: hypothetical protein PVH41_09455 [Anaerolineae bacterium]